MQCISSPTRTEIDAAHARGTYRDIGLPSLRNPSGWLKRILYGLLVLSTLPLHFFWNSAVFTKTQLLDYDVLVVKPEMISYPEVNCNPIMLKSTGLNRRRGAQGYYNYPVLTESRNLATPVWRNGVSLDRKYTMENLPLYTNGPNWYQAKVCEEANFMLAAAKQNELIRLSNEECMRNYGVPRARFSGWGSVFVVTKPEVKVHAANGSNPDMLLHFRYEGYVSNYTGDNWVCGPEHLLNNNYKCDYRKLVANSAAWTLGEISGDPNWDYGIVRTTEWPIDYCLADRTNLGGECQLQYSFVVMACVVAANVIKLVCMVIVLKTQREPVLATIGDGIASFLERPDRFTADTPFLSRTEARMFKYTGEKSHTGASLSKGVSLKGKPRKWKTRKFALRWWEAPSWRRRCITLILCIAAIITIFVLLQYCFTLTVDKAFPDTTSPWVMGFGTYNADATLPGLGGGAYDNARPDKDSFSSSTILMNLVALENLQQVIVSCLYFAYNTVYTCMVSADEWSRFSTH
ncbi:hypothetical protein HYFRA_00013695 [Hymenoscyphus fraxineus]|uniref:DUF6536 domain-containing protein n=1 Tax=Hymenoscyphus fraxineus TaxID=746836 RepID=A0A9N9PZY2_9HELO|nr:hypothetical protein HYFRA_00013695 [Hymenoscyphus fraxineus]